MFGMTSTLAATGSDSLVLYFVIGGILLAAGLGLIVLRALRKRPTSTKPGSADSAGDDDLQS